MNALSDVRVPVPVHPVRKALERFGGMTCAQIAEVTDLPLRHVQAAVARLRDNGVVADIGTLVPLDVDTSRAPDRCVRMWAWAVDVGGTVADYADAFGVLDATATDVRRLAIAAGLLAPLRSVYLTTDVEKLRDACWAEASKVPPRPDPMPSEKLPRHTRTVDALRVLRACLGHGLTREAARRMVGGDERRVRRIMADIAAAGWQVSAEHAGLIVVRREVA